MSGHYRQVSMERTTEEKRDVMAKVMRNIITESVQPFYNVDDQQKMVIFCAVHLRLSRTCSPQILSHLKKY